MSERMSGGKRFVYISDQLMFQALHTTHNSVDRLTVRSLR